MVQRVQSFDDLDGSPTTQTSRYGFADHPYEIDLDDEHAQEFEELLSRYIEHSRKVAEVQPQPSHASGGDAEVGESGVVLRSCRQFGSGHGSRVFR